MMNRRVYPIDTGSAAGKMFFGILAVFAQFEIDLRRERQLEGIAKTKAKGVYQGRKASIDPAEIIKLRDQGTSRCPSIECLRSSK